MLLPVVPDSAESSSENCPLSVSRAIEFWNACGVFMNIFLPHTMTTLLKSTPSSQRIDKFRSIIGI